MKTYIITGTSKGLGEALALQFIRHGHTVVGISRTENTMLQQTAKKTNSEFHEILADLTNTDKIPSVMEHVFSKISLSGQSDISLINNAGIVHPVAPSESASASDISRNVSLNLMAPMILTSEFIKRTEGCQSAKKIMNISSGAARKPYIGWSSYCSSKAGLDHFTRCVAAEQKDKQNGVKCVSIAPGVIDTGMQEDIRNLEKGKFPEQDRFIQLKEEGKLYTPGYAAEKLVQVLESEHFGSEAIMDIRDI
ncbi:(S)-benzoin forming benzil reductase [Bacillus sp. FJAT-42376]|uniref:(S)-benzoin forming benzil reductase n=1 Tax=Bacillus sp. FJAT-42376 TaxID=2014076 RepID=UPI0013DD9BBA|nr:(S)-benzoin forming benzil reductase [Bacillus sp. FJAT-42376]